MVSAYLSRDRYLGGCKLQLLGRGLPFPSEQADARQSIKGKAFSPSYASCRLSLYSPPVKSK